ncbi:MAG: glycosyltransferase family 4 protein [Actinobacteria bacterium]|nr:glycosyltransferase family 4 protein [Actinomycetota bacterium]
MTGTRVLLLTIDYAPQTGGQPRLVSSIVESTADLVAWRVVTAAPATSTEVGTDFTAQHVVRTSGFAGIAREAWRLRSWLTNSDDRLIVSGHVYLGWLAHLLGVLTRTRVSTLCYGRELVPAKLNQRLALLSLRRDHRVVTISSHSEHLLHRLGVSPEVTSWIGCELTPPAAFVSSEPSSRGNAIRLVAISRLAEGYKNLEIIMRATAVLVANGTVEHLTIVGEGPRRSALQHRIDQLGIQQHVTLAGHIANQELATVIAESDIGLFPSRDAPAEGGFEGFGIVVHELAAAGLPVVVGDAAGARDAADPAWATLIDPDDLRAWVAAIADLASNVELRQQRSLAAAEFGTRLDTSRTARTYLAALTGDGSIAPRTVDPDLAEI